jgi:hypothetical protein
MSVVLSADLQRTGSRLKSVKTSSFFEKWRFFANAVLQLFALSQRKHGLTLHFVQS